MSLKIRFRFEGRCSLHPRYNPEKEGRPCQKECQGCEALWVIHLYTGIARRKVRSSSGVLVARFEDSSQSHEPGQGDEAGATLEPASPPDVPSL